MQPVLSGWVGDVRESTFASADESNLWLGAAVGDDDVIGWRREQPNVEHVLRVRLRLELDCVHASPSLATNCLIDRRSRCFSAVAKHSVH